MEYFVNLVATNNDEPNEETPIFRPNTLISANRASWELTPVPRDESNPDGPPMLEIRYIRVIDWGDIPNVVIPPAEDTWMPPPLYPMLIPHAQQEAVVEDKPERSSLISLLLFAPIIIWNYLCFCVVHSQDYDQLLRGLNGSIIKEDVEQKYSRLSKGRKFQKSSTPSSPLSREPQEVNQNEQDDEHLSQVDNQSEEESPFIPSQNQDVEDELDLFPHDPGKRKPIASYPVNDRDVIRRAFIDKKACRPILKEDFPQTVEGLAFRGHNENETSNNKGNFRELLEWLAGRCESVAKIVLTSAPADESSDVSHREQLAICLSYVNKKGSVCERFLGVVKVCDTTSMTLMASIKELLDEYSLSMSNIRGQGYDGVSNMRGELNGLRNLIMRNNPYAYYVHCFAHQLQLTLVAVAKENCECAKFFMHLGIVLNVIGSSCKRMDMVREVQARKVLEALELGEIESGQGLNQELGLGRPGDTRWGSHFKSISNLTILFPTIIEVLVKIGSSSKCVDDRAKAQIAIDHLESFDFIFMLHLIKVIFGNTNDLYQALQRRDQDIVNAMTIVDMTKDNFQIMRDDGWDNFFDMVSDFCAKYDIEVPNMDDCYAPPGRSRRFLDKVTNLRRFRVDMFMSVIDKQIQELRSRFDETSMELLLCMACLNPDNLFSSFDKKKLLKLAKFYPKEFSSFDIEALTFQLDIYITNMRKDSRFHHLKNIGELLAKLIETNKQVSYPLVCLLCKLVLILLVATTSVERVFSSMTFVKNKLINRLGDKLLNHCLVTFIERDFFVQVSDDDIINRFQNLKSR
ncbi:hypothetical protein RND81_03G006200 [Saponaria officinalis]|uniref:Uncharacterized protein n=1 Tax=Saponaria officinalis TaxID=3572 RepID=A0AAW1LXP7_SAPOF